MNLRPPHAVDPAGDDGRSGHRPWMESRQALRRCGCSDVSLSCHGERSSRVVPRQLQPPAVPHDWPVSSQPRGKFLTGCVSSTGSTSSPASAARRCGCSGS